MPPAASIAKLDDHAIEVVTICQDVDRVLHILSVIGYLVFLSPPFTSIFPEFLFVPKRDFPLLVETNFQKIKFRDAIDVVTGVAQQCTSFH